MKLSPVSLSVSACLMAALSASANAAHWNISITNLTHGNHFTPLLVTAHDAGSHLFQVGHTASSALRLMAECGNIAELVDMYPVDDDTVANPVGSGDLLAPGASTTAMLHTDDTGNTHLSIVAMVLPTNDAFIGLDGLQVPTAAGTYTYYLNAYDAGTEANNELLSMGCAPGQAGIPAAPGDDAGMNGTGVSTADTNTTVHVHRGVLGDTDATGGASDLNSTIHRWQNPVAKVVITVTPTM